MALVAATPFLSEVARFAPPCLLKTFTGVPCPACGTTRAALALASGHPAAALRWNPLGALALVALVAGGLVAGARALAGKGVREPHSYPRSVRWAALAALLLNWAYLIAVGR